MSHFFHEIFDERWKSYSEELKTCREEFSAEAVHDLRVATRRLLAVIDMARLIEPHPRLQKARRTFKNQLDDLDELRDTQVMLAEISEWIEEFPALRPVQTKLQSDEKRLLRAAKKQVKSFELSELKKRMRKTQTGLTTNPDAVIDQHIFQAVDDAYLTGIQRYGQMDAADPATIHRARLSFKKFRYMVEIVHPALTEFPEINFERMHDYQAAMGEIQDTEWFLNAISEYVEKNASEDLQSVRGFYEKLHSDLISTFMEGKGEILTFWRATPDQPFPWDQSEYIPESAIETDDRPAS
jgi:CHAD domain-containing protein